VIVCSTSANPVVYVELPGASTPSTSSPRSTSTPTASNRSQRRSRRQTSAQARPPPFTEGDIAYGGSDRLIDPVVTQAMPSRPPSSSGAHLDTGADQPRREQTNTAAVMSANVDPHPPSSIPTARTRIIAPARP